MNRLTTRRPEAIVTVIAASFGFVVTQLDVTIVNVALPNIGAGLGAPLGDLQWIVDGYTLGFAALLLSAGTLSDRFGARTVYLAGLVSFALASAACGLASTAGVLVAARIVQGICATLLVPPSLALINHAFGHDKRLRARAVAVWTAAGGVAIAAGPVLGGFLVSALSWRAIFLVNLPLCLVGVLLTWRCGETPIGVGRRFDWAGQFLAIVTMSAFLGCIIEIGARGLGDPVVLASGTVALVCGIAFVRFEARIRDPMLPMTIFWLNGFSPALAFGVGANLAYYGIIFVLSLYLQQDRAYTPSMAGLVFVPLTATSILSNLVSGALMTRYGCRLPIVVGGLVASCGYALLLTLDHDSSAASMILPFILIPGGMGLGVPAMTTAILAIVSKGSSGTASGVLNAARQTGGAIGVAVFGALVASRGLIDGLHVAAVISAGLLAGVAFLAWTGITPESAQAPSNVK